MGTEVTGLRPDLYERLAATNPFAGRARRLFGRGEVVAVRGNEADLRVGYDGRGNALELKQVPIVSGYAPQVADWVAIGYEAGHAGAPWVMGPTMGSDVSADAVGIGVFATRSSDPTGALASTIYFDESRGVWRGFNGTQWVDFSDSGHVTAHNSLSGLQGGQAGEYYHLKASEHGGSWSHALIALAGDVVPIQGHRSTALTSSYASALFAKHISSGDVSDGFAVGIAFALQDNAGVENVVGRFAAARAGADNTADFVWWPATAGVFSERMRLSAAGALTISGGFAGTGAVLSGLSASRLLATDGSKALSSVSALSAWVGGTASRVMVTDDGDGSITLSGPQDMDTAASPTFAGLTLSGLTATRVVFAGAGGVVSDDANLTWSGSLLTVRGLTNRLVAKSTDSTNNAAHSGIRFVADVDSRYSSILGYRGAASTRMGLQFNVYNVSAAANAWLMDYNLQLLGYSGGSAAAPAIGLVSYPDDGVFWPGDGLFSVSLGGTERWRWSGNDVGMVAGGKHFWDGANCGGDTYTCESAANALADVVGGTNIFTRHPNRVWLNTGDPASPGNGDIFRSATYVNFQGKTGDSLGAFGRCLYRLIALQAGDTISGGTVAETAFASSYTVDSNLWCAGKTLQITARGYSSMSGNPTQGRAITIRMRIGGVSGTLVCPVPPWSRGTGTDVEYTSWRMTVTIKCVSTGAGGSVDVWAEWAITDDITTDITTNPANSEYVSGGSGGLPGGAGGLAGVYLRDAAMTLNTTADQQIVVTAQHDTAGGNAYSRLRFLEVWEVA